MSDVPVAAPAAVSVSAPSTTTPQPQAQSPANNTPVDAQTAAQTLENPAATKEEKKEAVKTLKKFNLKVYGRDVQDEVDMSDDKELTKRFQKAAAADISMKEAAEVRKAALEFIEQLRKNPKKVLMDPGIGVDIKKFAQEIMNEEINEAAKSPEQREKDKLTRELEELKEKYKKDEESRKQSEFERLQAEQETKLTEGISTALDTGGLPKTPYTVKKMAEMMMIALQNDIDLQPTDVVPLIRKQMQAEIKEMLSASSDDVLEEFLKEQIPRIRKRSVAKAKQVLSTAAQVKATVSPNKPTESKPQEKISMKKFFGI